MDFIYDIYKRYNSHVYFKPALPLVFMALYMFYYYTMISPVYSLSDCLAEIINPRAAMPYITGVFMIFVSLMYRDTLLKKIYFIMYLFSVVFSFALNLEGDINIISYIPYVIIAVINFIICFAFESYISNK